MAGRPVNAVFTSMEASIQLEERVERTPVVSDEEVLLWRAEILERAGYGARAVLLLATDKSVDLHQAVGLLEAGCPQVTALNILL
jgi:hypothetical protein